MKNFKDGQKNNFKQKKCDLHIHSIFSDSDMSVEDIFKEAKQADLSCISITDHDTIDSVKEAQKYSRVYDLEFITGIELSANYKDSEVHILGYFIDDTSERLRSELKKLKDLRLERILDMAGKLDSLGVCVDKEELLLRIGVGIPTRLHLALYLLEKNKVKSLQAAFKKYLAPGKPAYISRFKFSAEEAINFIKSYGGVSFLAHPHMVFDQDWVEEFISFGLDGLEVIYPTMSSAKSSVYENFAIKFNLLRSGGSDTHGSYKKFTGVGMTSIPYDWVQEMKKCLRIPTT